MILCFLVGTSMLGQAASTKPVLVKESPTGDEITKEIVEGFCRKIVEYVEEDLDNPKKSSFLKYASISGDLKKWMNYQFLELDSGIDKSWFVKVDEFIAFFMKTKREYETSSELSDSKFKTTNKKRFEVGLERFKALIDKPTPAKKERLDILKLQKKEYQRQKEAAERAKGGKPKKIRLSGDDD